MSTDTNPITDSHTRYYDEQIVDDDGKIVNDDNDIVNRVSLKLHNDIEDDGDSHNDENGLCTRDVAIREKRSNNNENDMLEGYSLGYEDTDTESKTRKHSSKGPPWYKSQRYILAYFHFFAMLVIFFQRTSFSIVIVCMVNHTATTATTTTSLSKQQREHNRPLDGRNISFNYSMFKPVNSPFEFNNNTTNNAHSNKNERELNSKYRTKHEIDKALHGPLNDLNRRLTTLLNYGDESDRIHNTDNSTSNNVDRCSAAIQKEEAEEDGPFLWDKETQGMLLSAIFWTYMACSVPGIALVRRFTRKRVSVVSILVLSCLTILMHAAALWNVWAVFVIRLLQGVCTPLALLSLYGMWSKWAPPQERTGLMSFCFSSQMLANALVYPIAAMLCKYGFLEGWPSVFYVFGSFGVIWSLLFLVLTSESPATHPWISHKEREYIQSSLAGHISLVKTPKTPWKSLLTSPPVWGLILVHFSLNWGMFLQLSTLPQYMKEVLKFKIDYNGLYLMLPYLATYFVGTFGGQLINWMIQRKTMRLIWIRKLTVVVANMTSAVLMCGLGYLDCNHSGLAVVILTLATGFIGLHFSVFLVNPYDIAPMYAQSILTVTNTIGCIPGVVTPYMVAVITKDKTQTQWRHVFFLVAAIYVVGTLGYCILGKADLQKWAAPNKTQCALISPGNGSLETERNDEQERNESSVL